MIPPSTVATLRTSQIFVAFIAQVLYSREQKHVLIRDTPMLLIEINSISNMGCQK